VKCSISLLAWFAAIKTAVDSGREATAPLLAMFDELLPVVLTLNQRSLLGTHRNDSSRNPLPDDEGTNTTTAKDIWA
jgi:hypothetical protein